MRPGRAELARIRIREDRRVGVVGELCPSEPFFGKNAIAESKMGKPPVKRILGSIPSGPARDFAFDGDEALERLRIFGTTIVRDTLSERARAGEKEKREKEG